MLKFPEVLWVVLLAVAIVLALGPGVPLWAWEDYLGHVRNTAYHPRCNHLVWVVHDVFWSCG